jgi:hypothetical protein
MVCGRNVLWPNRSVAETFRKQLNDLTVGGLLDFCQVLVLLPLAGNYLINIHML